jgi:hypothetical protein
VLSTVTTILALLVTVASWFLFKKAIVFQVGYTAICFIVIGIMWAQGVTRSVRANRHTTPDGETWFKSPGGLDRIAGGAAAAGAILNAIQAGFTIQGLANCPLQTPASLAELVYGAGLSTCSASTDWTAQYRQPYFAVQTLTYQMCLDDYGWTIAYVVLQLALMVMLVLVAIHEFRLDPHTQRIQRSWAHTEIAQRVDAARGVMVVTTRRRDHGSGKPSATEMLEIPFHSDNHGGGVTHRIVRLRIAAA